MTNIAHKNRETDNSLAAMHEGLGTNDVSRLFSRIQSTAPADSAQQHDLPRYQEIQRQQAAAAVASRWPLLNELLELEHSLGMGKSNHIAP